MIIFVTYETIVYPFILLVIGVVMVLVMTTAKVMVTVVACS